MKGLKVKHGRAIGLGASTLLMGMFMWNYYVRGIMPPPFYIPIYVGVLWMMIDNQSADSNELRIPFFVWYIRFRMNQKESQKFGRKRRRKY